MTISPTADGAAQRELSSAELCEMRAERGLMAVGESAVILLHPPSSFSRCFNRDREGASVK